MPITTWIVPYRLYGVWRVYNPENPRGHDKTPPEFKQGQISPQERLQNVNQLLGKIAEIAKKYDISIDPKPTYQQLVSRLCEPGQPDENLTLNMSLLPMEADQIVFRTIMNFLYKIGIKVYELENAYFENTFSETNNRDIAAVISKLPGLFEICQSPETYTIPSNNLILEILLETKNRSGLVTIDQLSLLAQIFDTRERENEDAIEVNQLFYRSFLKIDYLSRRDHLVVVVWRINGCISEILQEVYKIQRWAIRENQRLVQPSQQEERYEKIAQLNVWVDHVLCSISETYSAMVNTSLPQLSEPSDQAIKLQRKIAKIEQDIQYYIASGSAYKGIISDPRLFIPEFNAQERAWLEQMQHEVERVTVATTEIQHMLEERTGCLGIFLSMLNFKNREYWRKLRQMVANLNQVINEVRQTLSYLPQDDTGH